MLINLIIHLYRGAEVGRPILEIKNLSGRVNGKKILEQVSLTVKGGETHVIMGPNGTGKSTLAQLLMGKFGYEATGGEVLLNGEDLLGMPVDERARKGLFLAMQYPPEIAGVTNTEFLRAAVNAIREPGERPSLLQFDRELRKAIGELEMNPGLPERYLNEGFSGGEKKSNEILQMKLIKPAVAILDEIDSGLDIDALRTVGDNVSSLMEERGDEMGLLLITHYQRLLNYIKPQFVHVLMGGRIVYSGGPELALKLEKHGYEWLTEELGIQGSGLNDEFEEEISGADAAADKAALPEEEFSKKSGSEDMYSDGLDILV